MGLKRTHPCGILRTDHLGEEVILSGWVLRRRDHGGVIFIDLRDRSGVVQVVFEPKTAPEAHELAHSLKPEYVLSVKGRVRRRPEGMENPKLPTGEIEVEAHKLEVLNTSKTPPFPLDEEVPVSEALRLKYRYLDLRRPGGLEPLIFRHRVAQLARQFLNEQGFLRIRREPIGDPIDRRRQDRERSFLPRDGWCPPRCPVSPEHGQQVASGVH
ncbi:MAG TPA: hypothetical protein EYP81_01185, partial [Thermodesulfobacteriaceae bacterium]|nr:hypothetical protein [Thermodesulfobacteriaceae bacterium]